MTTTEKKNLLAKILNHRVDSFKVTTDRLGDTRIVYTGYRSGDIHLAQGFACDHGYHGSPARTITEAETQELYKAFNKDP